MKLIFNRPTLEGIAVVVGLFVIASALTGAVLGKKNTSQEGPLPPPSNLVVTPVTTQWLGYAAYVVEPGAKATGSVMTFTNSCQIGLRSDGVVVWRNNP